MLVAFVLMIEGGLNLSLDPGDEHQLSRWCQIKLEIFFLFFLSLRSLPLTDASTDLEQYIRDDFTISLRHIRWDECLSLSVICTVVQVNFLMVNYVRKLFLSNVKGFDCKGCWTTKTWRTLFNLHTLPFGMFVQFTIGTILDYYANWHGCCLLYLIQLRKYLVCILFLIHELAWAQLLTIIGSRR